MSADLVNPVALDDLLLDVVGAATPGMSVALLDDDLSELLLAWRHETEVRPIPELVDTPTAIATIQEGTAA